MAAHGEHTEEHTGEHTERTYEEGTGKRDSRERHEHRFFQESSFRPRNYYDNLVFLC